MEKQINKQIEALQLQAQTVMKETAIPIDERIQNVADIYREAEKLSNEGGLDGEKYESLLSYSAKFFSDYGLYKEALSRYLNLITLRESLYGQENPVTASAYHEIGNVYSSLCDFSTSLKYHMKAIGIRERVLGQKHKDTAESYNEIGLDYYNLGNYKEASEYISKAKDIREEVVGDDHPDIAESYGNIAMLSLKKEDYTNAMENYSKALNIYEETYGNDHRRTAAMYYCIGFIYNAQGNNSRAIDYCSKAVGVYEKILGSEHPETALSYLNIGFAHYSSGDFSKALEYYIKSLKIDEKMLGYEHLHTAAAYSAVGWLKYSMGEKEEAIDYNGRYLRIFEKILGLEHPDTADSYHDMGMMYFRFEDYGKAYEYYSKALEIYKKVTDTGLGNLKIKEIQEEMEDLFPVNQLSEEENITRDKDMEEIKGTRDLFLETLTKIGCQYELAEEENDDRIFFAYQGEHFFVNAKNDWRYIQIWDTHWASVELYDIDEYSRLKKAINSSNINNSVMTIYTVDEEGNTVDVHCKTTILFMSVIPDIEDYLKLELNEFFRAHQFIKLEMAKLRDKENA